MNRVVARSLAVLLLSVSACGGGGGGGGGGSEGATRDTAVRIIHASIDQTPVTIPGAEMNIQSAGYLESTSYARIPAGATTFQVLRKNSPTALLYNVPATIVDRTEYTLFIYGRASNDKDFAVLLTDIVAEPEPGLTNVQVLNGYDGSSNLRVSVGDMVLTPISRGGTSGYFTLPSGPQTFTVKNANGSMLTTVTVTLVDQGDATLVVSGAADLGVVFTRVYTDLD